MTVWPGRGGVGGSRSVIAESAEHDGGTLGASCDGAFGGAVAEIDVDDAYGLEDGQCFGGGEIEGVQP